MGKNKQLRQAQRAARQKFSSAGAATAGEHLPPHNETYCEWPCVMGQQKGREAAHQELGGEDDEWLKDYAVCQLVGSPAAGNPGTSGVQRVIVHERLRASTRLAAAIRTKALNAGRPRGSRCTLVRADQLSDSTQFEIATAQPEPERDLPLCTLPSALRVERLHRYDTAAYPFADRIADLILPLGFRCDCTASASCSVECLALLTRRGSFSPH